MKTWWDTSKPWHDYLTRCQYLLRQGLFVADICYLQPEGALGFPVPKPTVGHPPRSAGLQLRRLQCRSGADAHVGQGRANCAAGRNELSTPGAAGIADDDAGVMGILWKRPYRIEITDALKVGENTLEIKVTNLWINRMIGDEHLPEDSERNRAGTLKAWPEWLQDGKPSPTGRYTITTWRL